MKCLHISNDFSLTKVHKNLYSNLDDLNLEQIIFNPVRSNTPVGNNKLIFKTKGSKIIYSELLKTYHRIFFRDKIKFLFNDLDLKYELNRIEIVHATTLFSDGAIALKIHKKYNTPYIVAVRGTDVSMFLKYRPDLLFLLKEILNNASKIIFLSAATKKQFLNNFYVKLLKLNLNSKIIVICNGIDDYWLSNISPIKKTTPNKILYIGRFDNNKNTLKLIEGVKQLKKEFHDLELNLVGKGGKNEEQVISLSNEYKNFMKYHGAIHDKEELQRMYLSNHIFAMPSFSETFGLVYIEALSSGLPILCSHNQGIDGTFKFKVGEFVDPKSSDSIAAGLRSIIYNYNTFDLDQINFSKFRWEKIAKIYLDIYNKIT